MGYKNQSLNLREATNVFMDGALSQKTKELAEHDGAEAKKMLMAMRSFQEGAFWMCWRLFHEIEEKGERDVAGLMIIVNEVLAEHAKVRDIVEGGMFEPRH
jgi:hypothetical protein